MEGVTGCTGEQGPHAHPKLGLLLYISLFRECLVPPHAVHQVQGPEAALGVAALEGDAVLLHEALDRLV